MTTPAYLYELAKDEATDYPLPLEVELTVDNTPPPNTFKNLKILKKLGILNGDAVMSLLAQAPIDPLNLMQVLMETFPEGWAFSAIDFSMVRVLSKTAKGEVAAALQVDLLGASVTTMALNKANQLTVYKTLDATVGLLDSSKSLLIETQIMCDDAINAAQRENVG